MLTSGRPYSQTLGQARLGTDISLLQKFVNYGRKKFYLNGCPDRLGVQVPGWAGFGPPGTNVITLFWVVSHASVK